MSIEIIDDTSTEVNKTINNYDNNNDNNNNYDNNNDNNIEILRKQYITRGLSGLINIGNTCYMNAAIQCLSATIVLVTYFRGSGNGHGDYKNDLKHSIIRTIVEEKRKTDKHTKEVIVNMKEVKNRFRNSLSYKLRNLFVVLWGSNCKVKPKMFKLRLGELKNTFAGHSQNDSQECLSFILDQIHEETKTDVIIELRNIHQSVIEYQEVIDNYNKLVDNQSVIEYQEVDNQYISLNYKIKLKNDFNKFRNEHLKEYAFTKGVEYWQNFLKKNHSAIIDIFTGLFFTQIKCKNCNNFSFVYEPFNIISLAIPNIQNEITLDDCLTNNFNCDEHLINENKYYCDNCSNKHDAIKNTTIWHSPYILIIQFKRFVNISTSIYKNKKNIKFPINGLDIKKFVSYYVDGDHIYDLYSVIHHSGNLKGGHYVAYTKNAINGKWYLYDDANILHIDDDKLENKIVTSEAYVLFYKKREYITLTHSIIDDDNNDDL